MEIETNKLENVQTIKENEKIPQAYCDSCSNCLGNRCSIFERPVTSDNRCAYHSNDNIFVKKYISPSQRELDKMRDEEEREPKKVYLELAA